MYSRKPSLWLITGVILMLVGGFALPGATAHSALAQLPIERPPPAESGATLADLQSTAPTYQGTPTSITMDAEGYTIWTYDNWRDLENWCVQFSRLRWPFDLGAQDPTELSDTTLLFTFAQKVYVIDAEGNPLYTDPTWGVGLNGKPGPVAEGVFPTDGWNIIGAIGATPTRGYSVFVTQEVPFDHTELIDGENNVWFRQSDFCPQPELWDCACTCYDLASIKLRAWVELALKEMSPPPDARNVQVRVGDTEIRIKFTTLVSPTTVNKETFQLSYYDQELNQLMVDGSINALSDTEFTFTPAQPLKAGIRYEVQVWDRSEALSQGRDQWVMDFSGGPLEHGRTWSFWTLPDVQVEVVPVQVLENTPLIVNKATALRTFIHWELHPDVYMFDQVELIEVYDVSVRWQALQGTHAGHVQWRDNGYGWNLPYTFENARRKREYRTYNNPLDSYDKFERMAGRDSITYFGFIPLDSGTYDLSAVVTVLDPKGEPTITFHTATQPEALASRRFNLHHRAVAVGADYGATGTRDLSASIKDSSDTLRALFPVPTVTRPATPSAMPYYHPTTSLWFYDWSTEPAGAFPKKYLLQEMSQLCARTTGCDAMIGHVPQRWLTDIGLTLPESAPQGALVQHNVIAYLFLDFITAHEVGHLYGFEHDEHLDLRGGEGYHVSRRRDLRSSVALLEPHTQRTLNAIYDFMHIDPVDLPPTDRLWIHPSRYQVLLNRITGGFPRSAASNVPLDTSPLLLVSGVITPATGETQLLPWYELDPGPWTPPTPGPYDIVFLDAGGQPIAGYTRAFTVTTELRSAGAAALQNADGVTFFTLKIPYPPDMARVQIRRSADDALLAERVVSATPPALTLDPTAPVWSGDQTLTWNAGPGAHFALDVSTDGGATWEAFAINLTATEATLASASLPNTTQAYVRVAATDGLRTTTAVTGPFTIANPPVVSYVTPPPGSIADPALPVVVGFRDAMDAATINTHTFALSGGPHGTVSGTVMYDTEEREATFTPRAPLTYATIYTAHVSADVHDSAGDPLLAAFTWSFTTTVDPLPPIPLTFSPAPSARNVPPDAALTVLWNKALDPVTLTPERFTLATAEGVTVSGSIIYNDATHALTFQPAADLLTDTVYLATLHPGIADLVGNETVGEYRWAFRTGTRPPAGLRFIDSYADWGVDTNGDGLYEQLVIRVGVQVTETGSYALRGTLVDTDGGEITWDHITSTLTAGVHYLDLSFDGTAIGGRGVDGPYTLTDVALTRLNSVGAPLALTSVAQWDAHRTLAYTADRFPALLRFGGLPDVLLLPGTTALDAFNVREYAQHATLPSDQLSYTVMLNTHPQMGVSLQASGVLRVSPELYWQGRTQVTIRAGDGVRAVRDTVEITIGWPHALYLPVVLRNAGDSDMAVARNAWITYIHDDFESSWNWSVVSSMSVNPGGPIPLWGKSDCRAYSGQYSAWPMGGTRDGPPACGAEYPPTLEARMYGEVNLKYVTAGEYSAKVWMNLPPGDEICLEVKVDHLEHGCFFSAGYHGVCRSGETNGWEDLTLDLTNVPTLGNVLGEEHVCIQVLFKTDEADSRPEGAYVDDVNLRFCPEGLTEYCAGATVSPPTPAPLVAGNIGGYPEEIAEIALAVARDGRVHALWTGKLNPSFNNYVFYSSSPDGVTWSPYQILSYWSGYGPRIAVDNVHGRVHLAYGNDEGIVHQTIVNGALSAPVVVVPHRVYYTPGSPLPSGGIGIAGLATAEETGYAHLVWHEAYLARVGTGYSLRYRTWYAYWDSVEWTAPLRKINDQDTRYSSIAIAPDGQAMLAWFQRWAQSAGGGTGPGDPIVARTAYGTKPGSFPLRQATHDLYPEPQRDESIVLAYSGGDDSFVLGSDHFMWPGHSRVYRYVWKDGVWSEPLSVAENTDGVMAWSHVGAATETPLIRYVYHQDGVLKTRTETDGVLGPVQTIADYLDERGYSGSPLAYFTDAAGELHIVLAGEKGGVAGFYYVQP